MEGNNRGHRKGPLSQGGVWKQGRKNKWLGSRLITDETGRIGRRHIQNLRLRYKSKVGKKEREKKGFGAADVGHEGPAGNSASPRRKEQEKK